MKKQKSNQVTKYFSIISILSVIILFFVLAYINHNSESWWCRRNPDKCVCESYKIPKESRLVQEEIKKYCEEQGHMCIANMCSNFRLKTQAELDVDDCNNNPREDEKCKCIKYENNLNNPISGYACPNSCEDITVKDCHVRGLYSYNEEIEIEGYVAYDETCETKLRYNEPITGFKNVSIYFTERNITNCLECWNFEQICTKSRPKTECEKGNPDYIEENETAYKCSITWETCEGIVTEKEKNNWTNDETERYILSLAIPLVNPIKPLKILEFCQENIDIQNNSLILNQTTLDKYCKKQSETKTVCREK